MQHKLSYTVSALALGAALSLAAPAFAAHHNDPWVSGGGGPGPAPSAPAPHASGPSWAPGGGGGAHAAHVSGGGNPFAGHASRPHMFSSGQNFAHFSGAQRQNWSHGHWWHGRHGGHNGWWWFAGGGWFFYPYAVYPYPDYVSGTADYADGYYGGGNANNAWWYCASPAGYDPYVQNCMVPWRPVNPPAPQDAGGYGAPPGGGYGPPPGGGGDQYGPPPDGGPDDQGPPPDGGQYGPNDGPPNDGPPNDGPPPGNPPPGH